MIVFVDRETSSSIKRIFFSKSIFLYVEEVFLLVYIVTLCDWNVISFNKMDKVVCFQENSLILCHNFDRIKY